MLEDRRQFGVTRVSQVDTFGPGLGWTVTNEKLCEKTNIESTEVWVDPVLGT